VIGQIDGMVDIEKNGRKNRICGVIRSVAACCVVLISIVLYLYFLQVLLSSAKRCGAE